MHIQQNISLLKYNTFGINAIADQFTSIHSESELVQLYNSDLDLSNVFILGGGSNILFRKNFSGLVIKIEIEGIEVIEENEDYVLVRAGAGVVWHNLVMWVDTNAYS